MPKAVDITIGACGTLQGIYTPQLRVYADSEKHGVICDVFNLKHLGRFRDRKKAIAAGKKWLRRPGAEIAAEDAWDALNNGRTVYGWTYDQVKAAIDDALRRPQTVAVEEQLGA